MRPTAALRPRWSAGANDLRGRRQWRRLLDMVAHRQVNLIVVWKLDRAFRSVVDGATTLQNLRSCDCGIRSLQEPWIDTTTLMGEAMYHITLAWASVTERMHPSNGLLLCSTHHALFDADILTVGLDRRVACRQNEVPHHHWNDADHKAVTALHGHPIAVPTDERLRPSDAALTYRASR